MKFTIAKLWIRMKNNNKKYTECPECKSDKIILLKNDTLNKEDLWRRR